MLYLPALSRCYAIPGLRWYRVVRLYLNGVAAKELSKSFYTGCLCVWSNFRLPRFRVGFARGGKNRVMEFDTKFTVRWICLLLPLPSPHCAIAKLENDDELYTAPSFNRVRDFYGWKASVELVDHNLCRIGEFHQPRFLLGADWMLRFTAMIPRNGRETF